MLLRSLMLNNFCQHLERKVEFDPYLTVITGQNGVGKTNLLKGILFSIFGASGISSVTKDKLVSVGQGQLSVILNFDHGNVSYELYRELDKCYLIEKNEDDKKAFVERRHEELVKYLCDLIGVERSQALSFLYIEQGQMTKFISLTPAARMRYLLSLCGISHIEQLWKLLGTFISEHRYKYKLESLRDLKSEIEKVNSSISELEKRLVDLESDYESKQKDLGKYIYIIEEQREKDANNSKILLELKKLELLITKAEAKYRVAVAAIEEFGLFYSRAEKLIDSKIDMNNKELVIQELIRKSNELKEEKRSILDEKKEIEKILNIEQARINFAAGKFTICPVCGSDLSGKIDREKSELAINELLANLSELERKLQKLETLYGNCIAVLDYLNKHDITQLERNKSDIEQALADYKQRKEELEKSTLDDVQDVSEAIDFINSCDNEKREIESLRGKLEYNRGVSASLAERYEKALEGWLDFSRNDFAITSLEKIRENLDPTIVMRVLFEKLYPILQMEINDTLEKFGFSYFVTIDSEDSSLNVVCRENSFVVEDKQLSYGEKGIISFIVLLALSNMVSTEQSFLLIDEPTAGWDKYNRMRFIELINSKCFANRQVIMTTHHEDELFAGRMIEL